MNDISTQIISDILVRKLLAFGFDVLFPILIERSHLCRLV